MKVDYLIDKGSGSNNEDEFLIKDNLFGVFDGLTGLNRYKDAKGKTSGQIASQLVKKIFEDNSDEKLIDVLHRANKQINKEIENAKTNLSSKENRPGSSVAVVKIKNGCIDYIQIHDSPIIFIFKDGAYRMISGRQNIDLKTILLWKKIAVKQKIKGWYENKAILNILIQERKKVNVTYGCLNGEKEVFQFVLHGTLSLDNISHILLFTDGLFLPKQDPRKNEDIDRLVKLFLKHGLKYIKNYVRKLENSDPNSIKYPRFKQHDDIAAISVSFDIS